MLSIFEALYKQKKLKKIKTYIIKKNVPKRLGNCRKLAEEIGQFDNIFSTNESCISKENSI
jgi:hypothetical protein